MTGTVTPGSATTEAPEGCYLRLYVAGQSLKSLNASVNLKRLCEEHLAGRYDIETIDLLIHPARAQEDDIVAIPTVVRQLPPPVHKVIGDLSDTPRVLAGLRLRPKP